MNLFLWMLVQWTPKMCPFHISTNIFWWQVHFKHCFFISCLLCFHVLFKIYLQMSFSFSFFSAPPSTVDLLGRCCLEFSCKSIKEEHIHEEVTTMGRMGGGGGERQIGIPPPPPLKRRNCPQKQFPSTQGAHCIKLLPEDNSGYFNRSCLPMVKVNGKIMLTGVFRFYQSFFSGKSFMQ